MQSPAPELRQFGIAPQGLSHTTHLASRYKAHRRNLRRLGEHGTVCWRVQHGRALPGACVERFLELEDMGWKGQQGTSLRARPEDERFFRAMIDGFRDCGRVFFTEVCVNQEVIASTSNVVSGHAGFAFKVGWHPRYAKLAPGLLNELELIQHTLALAAISPGDEKSPLMPEVSIILPPYNRADTLSRAIDNVGRQTFTDGDLLVVDDGATERSESYETTSRCNRHYRV